MKIATTSIAAVAAIGFLAGASVSASACDWHKSHVNASATPAPPTEELAVPATSVDPVKLADAGKAALLPRAPEETEAE